MIYFRKFLCWLLGHRCICLHRHVYNHEVNMTSSSYTGWECESCGETFTRGWDE